MPAVNHSCVCETPSIHRFLWSRLAAGIDYEPRPKEAVDFPDMLIKL
jgi:hypothetical protein